MLEQLRPLLPKTWHVLVLCDRGLWSPTLDRVIDAAGWHPLMRVRNTSHFAPQGGCRVPAWLLLGGKGQAWVGAGQAFAPPRSLAATLIGVWLAGQEEPYLVLTNLPPEQVGIAWYGLRVWIEAGFRLLKSGGWQGHKTRRTDCERAARHFVVLAIATLWTLAYGTRLEEAALCPTRPTQVSACQPVRGRRVSVCRLG
ncbi:MAG TPA: transposase, partial [Chthonomonadaceae bacterium]|nr:transposase [Chthonomonadaceae bacterium]